MWKIIVITEKIYCVPASLWKTLNVSFDNFVSYENNKNIEGLVGNLGAKENILDLKKFWIKSTLFIKN